MGLLLSVLVACVGVLELLYLYNIVRNRVGYNISTPNLPEIQDENIRQLEDRRNQLILQLNRLKEQVLREKRFERLSSHEDITVEFNDQVVTPRSRTPSPRRFLLTEKKERSASPRHFLVSEEPQCLRNIQKSKTQQCVPEFLIREDEDHAKSQIPRFVLKDGNNKVPLSLPEKFFISEGSDVEENTVVKSKNVFEIDGDLYYQRSPSPFPDIELNHSKNGSCNSFLNESYSVAEVDENRRSKSTSPVEFTKYPNAAAVKITLNDHTTLDSSDFKDSLENNDTEDVLSSEGEESNTEFSKLGQLDDVDGTKGCKMKKKLLKRKRIKNKFNTKDSLGIL